MNMHAIAYPLTAMEVTWASDADYSGPQVEHAEFDRNDIRVIEGRLYWSATRFECTPID